MNSTSAPWLVRYPCGGGVPNPPVSRAQVATYWNQSVRRLTCRPVARLA